MIGKIVDVFTNSSIFTRDVIPVKGAEFRICSCSDVSCLAKMHGKVWIVWDCKGSVCDDFLIKSFKSHPIGSNCHITFIDGAQCSAFDRFLDRPSQSILIEHFYKLSSIGLEIGYNPIHKIDEFEIDSLNYALHYRGMKIALPMAEFRLFRYMANNPDRVLSFSELQKFLYASDSNIQKQAVQKQFSRLREALTNVGAGHHLRSVRSFGYVFDSSWTN